MAANNKKLLSGVVISDKMDKTIVVSYQQAFKHEKFQKIVRTVKKYKVHDPEEVAKIGDRVEFFEGAPKSKTKYMYLHRVIS
ncbi:MAG TPA: 30S ribosomal protein S17 [Candidatus Saccharimonadales bacterium]|nr:30S ribosomal protein S17 [Candidatus Saccharimonadales bacterium]